jgi:hypothetical protein
MKNNDKHKLVCIFQLKYENIISTNTSETILSADSQYFTLQVHSTKYRGWGIWTPASFLDGAGFKYLIRN